MKGMTDNTRNCIAYIAVNHPPGEFGTGAIPTPLRAGLSGLVRKEFITSRRVGPLSRVYQALPAGIQYAKRYADTEMAFWQGRGKYESGVPNE
jgi:hypothetical protein